jgi:ubiquitin carboxyl-terminal hydrolase 7
MIYFQIVPDEEIRLQEGSLDGKLVEVFHFSKEPFRSHGTPFLFRLVPGEVWSATKERLCQSMGMPRKDFDRIKIALCPRHGKHLYPEDGTIISIC